MTVEILEPETVQEPLRPPKRPWTPGDHAGDAQTGAVAYKCFRLRVLVAETGDNVYSDHEPEGPEDEEALQSFTSGGLRQASYALFTEAMRKEALYTILLKLQNDPEFEKRVAQATPEQQEQIEREIALVVAQTLTGEIQNNMIACTREAIEGIRQQAAVMQG